MSDLTHAIRQLRRNPGYTILAAGALGLGLGLVAAQFSLVDAVLLRSMPFPESHRLMHLGCQSAGDLPDQWHAMPMRDFLAYRGQQGAFDDLAAFRLGDVNLSRHGGPPQRCESAAVSANFFDVLRARPVLGRSFQPGEDDPGAAGLVLLGQELWRQQFGGTADVLGRVIQVNSEAMTVIGVMPDGFQFPVLQRLWTNLRDGPGDPRATAVGRVEAMGRLRSGVSRAQAAADLNMIARRLAAENGVTDRGSDRVLVQPFARAYAGVGAATIALTMQAMTLFVLLLACANVANLMLARVAGRNRELAVRAALGASRCRLVRQMLIESGVLAAAGTLAGFLLAGWGVDLLNHHVLGHVEVPFFVRFELNRPVLAVLAVAAVSAALIAGLAPALHAGRTEIQTALKDGGRGDSGRRPGRFARGLVVAQIAIACALVTAAAMMANTVRRARAVKLAPEPERLVIGRIKPGDDVHRTRPDLARFFDGLLERVRAIPGVEAAALSSRDLVNSAVYTRFEKEGEVYPHANERPGAWLEVVSKEYFSVVGVHAIEGRLFDGTDHSTGPASALVNLSFARRHWPGESPLGKRLRRDEAGAEWATVVGVVPDLCLEGLSNNDPPAGFYLLADQQGGGAMHLLVRARVPAPVMEPALRAAVGALDPDQPIDHLGTLAFHAERRLRVISIVGAMAVVFALAAALLATLGIYGVMAVAVSRRTREFGIRLALGSSLQGIRRLVLGSTLRQLGLGLGVGLLLAFLITRPLVPLLSEGVTGDPSLFAAVATLVAIVTLGAAWMPVRRATRVDPVVALRSE